MGQPFSVTATPCHIQLRLFRFSAPAGFLSAWFRLSRRGGGSPGGGLERRRRGPAPMAVPAKSAVARAVTQRPPSASITGIGGQIAAPRPMPARHTPAASQRTIPSTCEPLAVDWKPQHAPYRWRRSSTRISPGVDGGDRPKKPLFETPAGVFQCSASASSWPPTASVLVRDRPLPGASPSAAVTPLWSAPRRPAIRLSCHADVMKRPMAAPQIKRLAIPASQGHRSRPR